MLQQVISVSHGRVGRRSCDAAEPDPAIRVGHTHHRNLRKFPSQVAHGLGGRGIKCASWKASAATLSPQTHGRAGEGPIKNRLWEQEIDMRTNGPGFAQTVKSNERNRYAFIHGAPCADDAHQERTPTQALALAIGSKRL